MRGKNGGFSLTEALVVMGLIAILASLLLSHASQAVAKAHEATCMSNLKQLVSAIHMYAGDYDGKLLPLPWNRVPGCERPIPTDEHGPVVQDAVDLYLLGGYAPYGATTELWHCPSQPWPATPEDGREFIHQVRHRGGWLYAGIENLHYRTYYYTWLEGLEPKRCQLLQDKPESEYWIDSVVQDVGLLGAHASEPYGQGGQRKVDLWPHGDRRNWRRSRVCVGFIDGHVESLTPGEWKRRQFGHLPDWVKREVPWITWD
jgi:type II secretory pathway pseudopilin PulG